MTISITNGIIQESGGGNLPNFCALNGEETTTSGDFIRPSPFPTRRINMNEAVLKRKRYNDGTGDSTKQPEADLNVQNIANKRVNVNNVSIGIKNSFQLKTDEPCLENQVCSSPSSLVKSGYPNRTPSTTKIIGNVTHTPKVSLSKTRQNTGNYRNHNIQRNMNVTESQNVSSTVATSSPMLDNILSTALTQTTFTQPLQTSEWHNSTPSNLNIHPKCSNQIVFSNLKSNMDTNIESIHTSSNLYSPTSTHPVPAMSSTTTTIASPDSDSVLSTPELLQSNQFPLFNINVFEDISNNEPSINNGEQLSNTPASPYRLRVMLDQQAHSCQQNLSSTTSPSPLLSPFSRLNCNPVAISPTHSISATTSHHHESFHNENDTSTDIHWFDVNEMETFPPQAGLSHETDTPQSDRRRKNNKLSAQAYRGRKKLQEQEQQKVLKQLEIDQEKLRWKVASLKREKIIILKHLRENYKLDLELSDEDSE